MNLIFENIPLRVNEIRKRFEIEIGENFVFINYSKFGSQIALTHTETAQTFTGNGVGSVVVEKTLQYIETQQFMLLPFCPVVIAYIKNNPEWKRIVSNKFKDYHTI